MRRWLLCYMALTLPTLSLTCATIETERSSEIRIVPMERTPEPEDVEVRISYPEPNSIQQETSVMAQLRLELYPLGVYSDFHRASVLRDRNQGQAVAIIVDGQPAQFVNEPIDDISEPEEVDYDQIVNLDLGPLSPGEHVLRVFPIRSFDESLKGPSVFAMSRFYVGSKRPSLNVNLSKPFVTYNQPTGTFSEGQPILLDFFVTNTQLSSDGYKVRLTIDNAERWILNAWNPYYIYGLPPGEHTIKLELLSPGNRVLSPLFNDLERTITVR